MRKVTPGVGSEMRGQSGLSAAGIWRDKGPRGGGLSKRLSKWREGGNETEPLCAGYQEEVAQRAAF